jgi:hypothetical protein
MTTVTACAQCEALVDELRRELHNARERVKAAEKWLHILGALATDGERLMGGNGPIAYPRERATTEAGGRVA